MDARPPAQQPSADLDNPGIRMDGIDDLDVLESCRQIAERQADVLERRSEALPAVGGHEENFPASHGRQREGTFLSLGVI